MFVNNSLEIQFSAGKKKFEVKNNYSENKGKYSENSSVHAMSKLLHNTCKQQ